MSTLKVTDIQHPSASDPAIQLSPSGGILVSGAGDAPSGSTGVPWMLPYPEPGDAWGADAIKDLADAIVDGLDAAGNAGIGSNVVQAVKTNTFSSSSGSFVDVTGLEVTITPSSATSKILVMAYSVIANSNTVAGAHARLVRGSTVLLQGDADGSKVRATYGLLYSNGDDAYAFSPIFLDSPATSSAVTYKIQARRGNGGNVLINRAAAVANDARNAVSASTITAIEVAP